MLSKMYNKFSVFVAQFENAPPLLASMTSRKTEFIIARIRPERKEPFKQLSKRLGITESKLLLLLVDMAIDQPPEVAAPVKPDGNNADASIMKVRLPKFLKTAVQDRAASMDVPASRWVAALVQSNLTGQPVMFEPELFELRASNRALAAIGRNINQIARALNEAFHETERVKLDKLAELGAAIKENREVIRALVRASQNAWEAENGDN